MFKSILQTKQWAQLKEKYGQKAHWISDVLVLEHKLPFKKSFLYMPEVGQAQLHDMEKAKLDELAISTGAVFVRAEVVNETDEKESYLDEALKGFEKSRDEIQPKHRQIVNLRPTEEEILAQMKPKGRYNIKVAQRHEVIVQSYGPQDSHRAQNIEHETQFWGRSENYSSTRTSSGGEAGKVLDSVPRHSNDNDKIALSTASRNDNGGVDAVADFYNLYRQTVKREGITGRNIDYFHDLVDILGARNMAKVYIARLGDKALAGAIVTFYDGVASYLYGGSSNESREVMAPFALHFQIMKDAKALGMRYYDLLGIAPPNKPKHKWAGLSRFKENFGGKAVEIIGGYDKVYNRTWYGLFKMFRGKE